MPIMKCKSGHASLGKASLAAGAEVQFSSYFYNTDSSGHSVWISSGVTPDANGNFTIPNLRGLPRLQSSGGWWHSWRIRRPHKSSVYDLRDGFWGELTLARGRCRLSRSKPKTERWTAGSRLETATRWMRPGITRSWGSLPTTTGSTYWSMTVSPPRRVVRCHQRFDRGVRRHGERTAHDCNDGVSLLESAASGIFLHGKFQREKQHHP